MPRLLKRLPIASLLLITNLLSPSAISAAPPIEMLYCGNMTDSDGGVFSTGEFRFQIIDETGAIKWSTSNISTSFSETGDFCITLGRDTEALTPDIFEGDQRLFLRTSFKSDTRSQFETLSPDTPLLYTSFAVTAANATSAGSTTESDSVTTRSDGLDVENGDLTVSSGDLILKEGDVTASSGTVTAATGIFSGDLTTSAGDLIVSAGDIIASAGTVSSNALSSGTGVFSGDVTVDKKVLTVDATNDRVGVGLTTPAVTFDVAGDGRIVTDNTTGTGFLVDCSSITTGNCFSIDTQANLSTGGKALQIKFDSTKAGTIFDVWDVHTGTSVFNISSTGAVNVGTGNVSGTNLASDSVTSTKIVDETITNADISPTAAIDVDKLASGSSGQILVGNASGVPTYVTLSGDATLSNTGVVSISPNVINADELAGTINFSDGDLVSFAAINASSATEGLILPQATDVSAATAEGQISWDSDDDRLYVGDGSAVIGIVSSPYPAAIQTGLNGTDGQLVIYSEQGETDYSVTINPHPAMTQAVTYTLPPDDGTNGQVLQTDGNGALRWAAPATAYDDIAAPDAPTTIAFGGNTNTWTSTLDNGTVFTLANTDPDLANTTTLLKLKFTADGDPQGVFFEALDNNGSDSKFKIADNGDTTVGGKLTVAGTNERITAQSGEYIDFGSENLIEMSHRVYAPSGVAIGANNTNNLIDDAPNGAGSTTLYIGNASINVTFTGPHWYFRHDDDLQRGELVKLNDNYEIIRSTEPNDPAVIGIYWGVPDTKDALQREGVAYSVAAAGDSYDIHDQYNLTGAWVCDEGGPIHAGDLLTSADRDGYLKKQEDNIVRSYTVGKALVDIPFDDDGTNHSAYIYLYP